MNELIHWGIGLLRQVTFIFSAALVSVAALGSAQNITSRSSHLNWNAVYGGGGDAFTPSDLATDSGIVASDAETLSFSDSKSGFILGDPNRPWSAAVAVELVHGFSILGPLDNFNKITASGQTFVAAASGGEGLANIVAQSPGNELKFEFSLADARDVRLRGAVDLNPDGQNLSGSVILQRWDGFTWATVFNSLFLPGQEGAFDNSYSLITGDYRIIGQASGNAFHGVRPSQTNTWNYELTVVPEPGTMAALGLGVAALIRRRRNK